MDTNQEREEKEKTRKERIKISSKCKISSKVAATKPPVQCCPLSRNLFNEWKEHTAYIRSPCRRANSRFYIMFLMLAYTNNKFQNM